MANTRELTKAMDTLEEEALSLLANPDLTPFERRLAFEGLLRRYRVLADYQQALAAYIRRMTDLQDDDTPDPEGIIREILSSPEFVGLRLALLAALIALVYGNGPRAGWVPITLVPVMMLGLRL